MYKDTPPIRILRWHDSREEDGPREHAPVWISTDGIRCIFEQRGLAPSHVPMTVIRYEDGKTETSFDEKAPQFVERLARHVREFRLEEMQELGALVGQTVSAAMPLKESPPAPAPPENIANHLNRQALAEAIWQEMREELPPRIFSGDVTMSLEAALEETGLRIVPSGESGLGWVVRVARAMAELEQQEKGRVIDLPGVIERLQIALENERFVIVPAEEEEDV